MIQKESFDLFHAYKNMVNAEQHLSLILNSGKVAYRAKDLILCLKRRIDVNIRDIKVLLPPDAAKILQEQMLDNEVTLQMQNINDMCAELPKAIRDQVESYIENYHKVYKQK
jgi:hypothetical protein